MNPFYLKLRGLCIFGFVKWDPSHMLHQLTKLYSYIVSTFYFAPTIYYVDTYIFSFILINFINIILHIMHNFIHCLHQLHVVYYVP